MAGGTARIQILAIVLLAAAGCESEAPPPETAAPDAPAAPAAPMERAPERTVTGAATAPDGVTIAFDARGSDSPALVFVHCWACNREFWRHQFAEFSEDHRVIAIDLGGHGQSGTNRERWTVTDLGGDVAAVVTQLDLTDVVLVGHSMGGPVSLEAARLLPGRVLAVVGADTLHDAEAELPEEQIEAFAAAFEQDFGGQLKAMFEGMSGAGLEPELRDWIVAEASRTPPEVGVGLLRSYSQIDIPQMLRSAEVPVRVINAAAGGAIPATDVARNSQYADFDAVIVPGVGHFLQLEEPMTFNRHLREILSEIADL